MKKIIALIIATAFMCLSLFAICVHAEDKPAYRMTLTGPVSMSMDQTDEFIIKISDIDSATSGLKEIAVTLTYYKGDFSYVSSKSTLPSGWNINVRETTNGNTVTLVIVAAVASSSAKPVTTSDAVSIKLKFKFLPYTGSSASILVSSLTGTASSTDYGTVTGAGSGVTVKRALIQGQKPESPVLINKGETSVDLMKSNEDGIEYSYDLSTWQTSRTFKNLVKNGIYTFYARRAATEYYSASEPSEGLRVVLGNGSAGEITDSGSGGTDTPDDGSYTPKILSATANIIIISVEKGYEYSLNVGKMEWSTTGIFTGLTPGTKYWLFWRNIETKQTDMMLVETKREQLGKAPAPTLKNATESSIELNAVNGCEYSKDSKEWQSSPLFTGLEANKKYIFYQRYAATDTSEAGEMSDPVLFETKEIKPVCTHSKVTTSEKSATCTENGYIIRKCDLCGETIYSETINAKGHDLEWREKNATCTEAGLKEQYCKVCEKVISSEVVPAKGHTPGVEATCTEPQKCTVCGAVIAEAKGHKEGAPEVEVAATADKEGSRVIKCTVCGEVVRREVIPKLSDGTTGGKDTDKKPGSVIKIVVVLAIVAVVAAAGAVLFVLAKGTGSGPKKGGRASIGSSQQRK